MANPQTISDLFLSQYFRDTVEEVFWLEPGKIHMQNLLSTTMILQMLLMILSSKRDAALKLKSVFSVLTLSRACCETFVRISEDLTQITSD